MRYGDLKVNVEKGEFELPNGNVLSVDTVASLCYAYEILCTYEYIRDFDSLENVDDSTVWCLAEDIRDRMNDLDSMEGEIADEVIEDYLDDQE